MSAQYRDFRNQKMQKRFDHSHYHCANSPTVYITI